MSNSSSSTRIPGPPPTFGLGSFGNLISFFGNAPRYMERLKNNWGDIACLVKGGNPPIAFQPYPDMPKSLTVFAFGPEHNREILTNVDVFSLNRPVRGPQTGGIGNNLALDTKERHSVRRKNIMPALSRSHLQSYYDDIVTYTEQMVDRWQDSQVVDITAETQQLTADIATKTLFGLDPTPTQKDFARAVCKMVDLQFSSANLMPLNIPGLPYWRMMKSTEKVVRFLEMEIERKRRAGALGDDVLSMMIKAVDEQDAGFTNEELLGDAFLINFANFTTVWAVLALTLILLAQHPKVMDELAEELDRELGGRPPSYEEIHRLDVLDRVIKETLRIVAPGIMTPRFAKEDTTLGGYDIPRGSEVIFSTYITQRDPEIFPEPKKFIPDRWKEIKPSPFEYLPFGYGPHKCLGASFGAMQLRLMLPIIVQKYRLAMVPGSTIDFVFRITMRPKGRVPMIAKAAAGKPGDTKVDLKGYICEMIDFG